MASYKESRDQLQLGLVQAITMITMHFIHPLADRELQIQRHSAGPELMVHFTSLALFEAERRKKMFLFLQKVKICKACNS